MKKLSVQMLAMLITVMSMSSCATMFSGSKYKASFEVDGHPDATVRVKGYGKVRQGEEIKLRRHGKKTVTIEEPGCDKVTKTYKNTVNWATTTNLVLIPLVGLGLDAATGAMFTPKKGEEVHKHRKKTFVYEIQDYDDACKVASDQKVKSAESNQ